MTVDSLILLVVSIALGGLFLLSGVKKLADLATFRETLENYHLLPWTLIPVATLVMPLAELVAGVAAVATPIVHGLPGLIPAAGLLIVYALAMGINVARGRTHVDCGCLGFGATRTTIGWALVLRNAVLAGVALLLTVLPGNGRALAAIDWVSALGALSCAALFYLAFDQLAALRAKQEIFR